jgi:hypothetical protein
MKASPLSDICLTHCSLKRILGEIRENSSRKLGVSHKLYKFRNMLTYISANGYVRT